MVKTVKCSIYARNSSPNQRDASIEDQIRKCREAAHAKGWEVLEEHIYTDRAKTGTRMNMRDGLKTMMKVAMDNNCPFQRIVVDDTSRIARNTKDALNIFSLLTFYGVHVYYVAQGIDTTHAAAEEMITINGLIDSLHIRNLRSETFRGVEGQVLNGYSGGGRRYGYYSVPVFSGKVDIYGNPEADGYNLRIDPDQANTVIRICRLFGEEGCSAKKIVNILNRELIDTGTPKPPRGDYWGVSTLLGNRKNFRGILNNEIYVGKYYWNRSVSMRNPDTGQVCIRLKDEDKWILSSKPDLRIISDELWDKVKKRQRELKDFGHGRYMKAIPAYSTNLLTGLMTCSQCGANIVIVSGGKFAKYGCSSNSNNGPAVCSNDIKIKKPELERAVLDALDISFDSERNLDYLTAKVNAVLRAKFAQDRPKWKGVSLREQLKKTTKEIANFIDAIKAGLISDTVKDQLMTAEKKKKDIEALLTDAAEEAPAVPSVSSSVVGGYLLDIRATLGLHPVHGRGLLYGIINRIIVEPSDNAAKISVYCKENGILAGTSLIAIVPASHPKGRTHELCTPDDLAA